MVQEAIRFAEYWDKKNFGAISRQVYHFGKATLNEKQEAGRIRKIFEDKILMDYRITEIKDCSPAITEVTLFFRILYKDKEFDKMITLRLLYKGKSNEILLLGDKNGEWKFIENFFYQIDSIF